MPYGNALACCRDGRPILLNSGSAYGPARIWPAEYFGRLARRIVAQCDHDVLVMCGPNERAVANEIVKFAASQRVFSMADQPLDLGTAKACIRRGRLMVSTDSGPRHMAAALGKPVITFYGPTPPVWSENPTQRAINLALGLDCIACRKRACPLGHHRCMRELTVDMAFAAVTKMLDTCSATPEPRFAPGSGDSAYPAGPAAPHFPVPIDNAHTFNIREGTVAPT